jgi:hypothetical protein
LAALPLKEQIMGRMLGLILLLTLALPMPGSAQQLPTLPGPPTPDDEVSLYVLIGQWRRLADNRIEVQTRSGAWMQFPPDGIWTSGKLILYNGVPGLDIRLPRTQLDEMRRVIENEIPPYKWGLIEHWQ